MAAKRPKRRVTSSSTEPITTRGWMIVLGGVVTGAVILGAWLPVGALLNQRSQIALATARLAQLTHESKVLTSESTQLPSAWSQLGREQYELVPPGDRLIQMLNPSGAPSSASTGGPYPGDPGLSAPVVPGASSVVAEGSHPAASTKTAPTGPRGSFLSRVEAAVEFWR